MGAHRKEKQLSNQYSLNSHAIQIPESVNVSKQESDRMDVHCMRTSLGKSIHCPNGIMYCWKDFVHQMSHTFTQNVSEANTISRHHKSVDHRTNHRVKECLAESAID